VIRVTQVLLNLRKKPPLTPHPANLSHGEQKGGGQSETEAICWKRLQQYPAVAITLPSIFVEIAIKPFIK
jgi:hypothetical protein